MQLDFFGKIIPELGVASTSVPMSILGMVAGHTRRLRLSLSPRLSCPKAEPDGEAKPALFDSEADFVTAKRPLIRHKKLIGSEYDDH